MSMAVRPQVVDADTERRARNGVMTLAPAWRPGLVNLIGYA